MKILVLCTSYPEDELKYGGMFYHIRNKFYASKGLDVTVINFTSNRDYTIDGVNVITYSTYIKNYINMPYQILISHAPDMTYHYKFLKKYHLLFKSIVFFLHGFEVLNYRKFIKQDYYFNKRSIIYELKRKTNNHIKKRMWRNFFTSNKNKIYFIFVSDWMHREFFEWINLPSLIFKGKTRIIFNGVNDIFYNNKYDIGAKKDYDFITLRGNLDAPKYCVDLINEIALLNPDQKFLLIGRGDFFHNIFKAPNITWINKVIKPQEMLPYVNNSKCALMLTRCDAQGLMMCELATFGIPLITSDIDVCKEMLNDFTNVKFVENKKIENITNIKKELIHNYKYSRKEKFIHSNTISQELLFFSDITHGQ